MAKSVGGDSLLFTSTVKEWGGTVGLVYLRCEKAFVSPIV